MLSFSRGKGISFKLKNKVVFCGFYTKKKEPYIKGLFLWKIIVRITFMESQRDSL